jgi:hypothetical protein
MRIVRSLRWMVLVGALALGAGPAAAEQGDLETGVARSKNLANRTITIEDETFRVTGATRILDARGHPVPLEAVTTVDDAGGLVGLDAVYYAYSARGAELELLRPARPPR